MKQHHLQCQNPKHATSQILFICLNPKCMKKRKCCVLCIDEEHQKHEFLSINKFFQEISSNIQKNQKHSQKKELYKLVKQTRANIKTEFQIIRSQLIHSINVIENNLNMQLDTLIQILSCIDKETMKAHIINTFESTDAAINEYLQLSEKSKNIEIGDLQQMKKVFRVQVQALSSQLYECGEKALKSFEGLRKFTNSAKFYGRKYETDFVFSSKNKPLSAQLSDSIKTLSRLLVPNHYTVCCFDKPLDPINNKFFVRIDSNPSKKLWLGVCLLDVVKKSNFLVCNGLGKGTYAIDQTTGATYSYNNPNNYATFSNHHSAQLNPSGHNTITAGWNFKEGDIVMVKINYSSLQIEFFIMNQQFNSEDSGEGGQVALDEFSMTIQLRHGQFYPFVGTSAISEDSATILSQQQTQTLVQSFGNAWQQFDNLGEQNSDDQIFFDE